MRELMGGDLGEELLNVEQGIRQVAISVATQYFSKLPRIRPAQPAPHAG